MGLSAGRTRRIARKLIVAIDGPAGSGKSSTAKTLAKHLGLPYIDTGAMYRALTLKVLRLGVPLRDGLRVAALLRKSRIELYGRDPMRQRVFLDGRDVSRAIRDPELTQNVFYVAREPLVRRQMVQLQRRMGRERGGVMEGRDIGTVVFPKADYKFYFRADEKIRAKRRQRELSAVGRAAPLSGVLRDLRVRDRADTRRRVGPLRRAADAFLIDTSSLTIQETVDKMLAHIRSNSLKPSRLARKR